MMKGYYIGLMIILMGLSSCANSRYSHLKLKGDAKNAERIAYVKGFATEFFSRCEKEDYSEMKSYPMDVNMKARLQPDKFRRLCQYYNRNYGKITVGELSSANTDFYAKNFLDYFTFHAKNSINDSVKFVRVKVYRDDNMIQYISVPKEKPTVNKKTANKK